MKNEVHRLRISFANLPIGKRGSNLDKFTIKTAKETILTCVLVEESGQFSWELVDIGPCRAFSNTRLYGFKSGAAYEAEIGKRLVNGKCMLAEEYITSLRMAQIFNIDDLKNCKLISTVVVRSSDLDRLKNDEFYGSSIDTDICTMEEVGKHLKFEIPLIDLNHVAVADNAPWSGVDKTVSMEFHFPQSMPNSVKGPLTGETVDMF